MKIWYHDSSPSPLLRLGFFAISGPSSVSSRARFFDTVSADSIESPMVGRSDSCCLNAGAVLLPGGFDPEDSWGVHSCSVELAEVRASDGSSVGVVIFGTWL